MAMLNATSSQGDQPQRPHPAWGRVAAYGFVLALLGLLGWGLVKVQAGPRAAGPAPDFTLTTFGGEQVTLSDLRGRVVAINFWASWCPPCREEAAYLESTWRDYKDGTLRGVKIGPLAAPELEQRLEALLAEAYP